MSPPGHTWRTEFTSPFIASLALGAIGLVVLGLQPLLYSQYVAEGRLSPANLGLLAALEIAAIAFGSAFGVGVLRRLSLFYVVAFAALLLVLGNGSANVVPLLVARPVSGLGGGMLVAIAAVRIAQHPRLNRAAGLFLLFQALAQYGLVVWVSTLQAGASTAEIHLTLCILAGAVPFLLLPALRHLTPDDAQPMSALPETTAQSDIGLMYRSFALLAASLFVGGAISLWAYLGLWLQGQEIDRTLADTLLSVCLLGQLSGALLAVVFDAYGRSTRRILTASLFLIVSILCLILEAVTASPLSEILSKGTGLFVFVFGAAWIAATAAVTGFLEEVDPSRKIVPYAAAAQLSGAATVPTIAGLTLVPIGLTPLFLSCLVVIGISVTLMMILTVKSQRNGPGVADT